MPKFDIKCEVSLSLSCVSCPTVFKRTWRHELVISKNTIVKVAQREGWGIDEEAKEATCPNCLKQEIKSEIFNKPAYENH